MAICTATEVNAQIAIITEAVVGVDGRRPVVITANTQAQTRNMSCGIIDKPEIIEVMLVPENNIRDIIATVKKSPKAISAATATRNIATMATALQKITASAPPSLACGWFANSASLSVRQPACGC